MPATTIHTLPKRSVAVSSLKWQPLDIAVGATLGAACNHHSYSSETFGRRIVAEMAAVGHRGRCHTGRGLRRDLLGIQLRVHADLFGVWCDSARFRQHRARRLVFLRYAGGADSAQTLSGAVREPYRHAGRNGDW